MAACEYSIIGVDSAAACTDGYDDKSDTGHNKEVIHDEAQTQPYLSSVGFHFRCSERCVIFNNKLDEWGVNHLVLQGANVLLFLLMIGSAYIHIKAYYKPNPHAFLRSVLSATVLKLFVIAGAVFLYLFVAGEKQSIYAVLAGLILYVIYTFVEMRGIMKINKQTRNDTA